MRATSTDMLFHSAEFFLLFFITIVGYWTIKEHRLRKLWLLAASCGFYGSWNPWLTLVVLFSAAFDFFIAQRIEATESPKARRILLIVSVCVSLGILAFFKYTNFLLDAGVSFLNLFGVNHSHAVLRIVLPLGISFYTFETISYVVDVYRGRFRAERNFLDYALFIMFFPHLIAGPIIRPWHFLSQVPHLKKFDWNRMELGFRLFLLGLIKKAVIADHMSTLVDPVFAAPADFSSQAIWTAVLCYATQIYCDFSGYSDMAVGLAHAFGFKLPQNFNMPYLASNIAEFWRRWHISLSTWLRDYLYIPLGGSRHGTMATYRNLMVTMLLGGLWHGAGWNFLFWGLYHGALLSIHRAIAQHSRPPRAWLMPVRMLSTLLCVCIGWVLFRAQNMSVAWLILRRMFLPTEGQSFASADNAIALAAWAALTAGHFIGVYYKDPGAVLQRLPAPILATAMAATFLLVQVLMPHKGGAFIYFQF
jgi:alginate O-acetyltransferase complex protein AlgI